MLKKNIFETICRKHQVRKSLKPPPPVIFMTISGPSTSYLLRHFPVTEDTRTASSTASKASSALLALVAGCSTVVALSASNIPVPQDGARIQL